MSAGVAQKVARSLMERLVNGSGQLMNSETKEETKSYYRRSLPGTMMQFAKIVSSACTKYTASSDAEVAENWSMLAALLSQMDGFNGDESVWTWTPVDGATDEVIYDMVSAAFKNFETAFQISEPDSGKRKATTTEPELNGDFSSLDINGIHPEDVAGLRAAMQAIEIDPNKIKKNAAATAALKSIADGKIPQSLGVGQGGATGMHLPGAEPHFSSLSHDKSYLEDSRDEEDEIFLTVDGKFKRKHNNLKPTFSEWNHMNKVVENNARKVSPAFVKKVEGFHQALADLVDANGLDAIMTFDKFFRSRLASGHVTSIDPDSVKVAFLVRQQAAMVGDPKKLRRNGAGELARPPRASGSGTKTCNIFNRGERCKFKASCIFSHKCDKCGGNHPGKDCRKQTLALP